MVKSWVAVSVPSDTCNETSCSPTSPAAGVPVRTAVPSPLSVNVSHAGTVGAVTVRVAPLSGSEAVMS